MDATNNRFYRESPTKHPTDLLERKAKIQTMQRQQPSYVGTHDAIREWMDDAAREIERLRQFEPAPHPDGFDLNG